MKKKWLRLKKVGSFLRLQVIRISQREAKTGLVFEAKNVLAPVDPRCQNGENLGAKWSTANGPAFFSISAVERRSPIGKQQQRYLKELLEHALHQEQTRCREAEARRAEAESKCEEAKSQRARAEAQRELAEERREEERAGRVVAELKLVRARAALYEVFRSM